MMIPTQDPATRFTRELTPGEERSLERIAVYIGLCGRYRAAMRDAMDHLRPDEPAYKRLALALEDKP